MPIARLQLIGFLSNVDRFVSPPLLLMVASHFRVPLTVASLVASIHLLAYGVTQLPWAWVIARWGPITAMRSALLGAGAFATASAVAPSVVLVVTFRALGGTCLAGAVPAALLYIGTRYRRGDRPRGFTRVVSANGMGIVAAVAIAAAAILASLWWSAYLAVGAMLLLCGGTMPRRPRGDDGPTRTQAPIGLNRGRGPIRPGAIAAPALLVFLEGTFVVGVVSMLPSVVAQAGLAATVGGLTLLVYGFSMPLTSRLLGHERIQDFVVGHRVSSFTTLMLLGAAALALLSPAASAFIAAMTLGGCWTVLHPGLQVQATEAWPTIPSYGVGIFVTALFLGSATGTQVFSILLEGGGVPAVAVATGSGAIMLALASRLLSTKSRG